MRRSSTAAFYSKVKPTAPSANAAPVVTPASDENSSPRLPKSPPPPTLSVKEARTWEHDRQRVKKTAELIKSKARKAQAAAHDGWSPAKLYQRHSSHSTVAVRTLLDDDQPVVAESEIDWDDVASPLRSSHVERDWELGREVVPPGRSEVPLTDLLIARKPRHVRGRSDFEVVPHIRSVIVLDDTTVPDVDFGEPWEHVDANEVNDHTPNPSYAKIAALN
ncbi:hypothetical protein DXG03_003792 [Asterophora parasitica]|uniref:Uncharacterized protein n=1 Tax=Asterophora parasitica TaxID=117018 RepID=A0A9P7G3B2_9AGAR|nr:hypothetical protein DXG03_003792 [Asterophora parasitica]